jgi:hypothetical protein
MKGEDSPLMRFVMTNMGLWFAFGLGVCLEYYYPSPHIPEVAVVTVISGVVLCILGLWRRGRDKTWKQF